VCRVIVSGFRKGRSQELRVARGKSYSSNCAKMIIAIIATGYTAA